MSIPIRALIFDFDGLLVDTETPAYESWLRIYAEHGLELPLALWKEALGTAHGFDALAHLAARVGPALDRVAVRARRLRLKEELSAGQPLLPGVRAILDQADALGLPRAVASSSDRRWVVGWLARHNILQRFACVRTADDVRYTKPDPELFLSAAACLGVAPAGCLVFEDSPNGILAARAAGMRCVAVPSPITRRIALPEADLVLERLDALPLAEIIGRV
ncbi:MAG TPA: HAD family hydrolase [Roseiflexaceae bacterium]|nr:HAD family hydrolase [Roseiflexaceae bacterium]